MQLQFHRPILALFPSYAFVSQLHMEDLCKQDVEYGEHVYLLEAGE